MVDRYSSLPIEGAAAEALPWSDWWPDFTPDELRCKGTGILLIVPSSLTKLQMLRDRLGFPLSVNSAYRSPSYNDAIASTGLDGPHTTARAYDLDVVGARAFQVVDLAPAFGFTGIGVKQHGPHNKRFVHLDDLADNETKGPRPWLWSYP